MKAKFWVLVLLLTACTAQPVAPTPTLRHVPVFIPLPIKETVTMIPLPSAAVTVAGSATPAFTLAPYEQYSIEYLRART